MHAGISIPMTTPQDNTHRMGKMGPSGNMTSHTDHHHHGSALKTSAPATAHCLVGCVIGETAGLAIGVTLGLGVAATIALAVILAYVAGLSMATLPVMRLSSSRSAPPFASCGSPKASQLRSWSWL